VRGSAKRAETGVSSAERSLPDQVASSEFHLSQNKILLPRVECLLSSNECHLSVKTSIVEKYADVYCTGVNHFMWQNMMPFQERNIQGNVNVDVTLVRFDCQCAVVRESRVMLSEAKHLLADEERPFPFVPQGFGSRAQGDTIESG
jgi:hypothetical protein